MRHVYVLGDGQLGRMLRQAGEPSGITVWTIGEQTRASALPVAPDVITAEIERWPYTPLTQQLEQHPAFVNRDIFPLIADRLTQKQLLDSLNLPVTHWQLLTSDTQWPALFARLGSDLVVKRRTGGYDGRGQWRISAKHAQQHSTAPDVLPVECYGQCIVEQAINFTGEVSLIGARNLYGECVFFPLTHNLHQQGILRASVALPGVNPLQQQAQTLLGAIMQRLNYIGVMAMECFVTPQGLLINELAPRVHNSGHWTQNGASISQFALHLYAILGLPTPAPRTDQPSVMINLIGCDLNSQWLSVPYLHLHWYHKQVRDGRKVGHLNLTAPTVTTLCQALRQLPALLPRDYAPIIHQAEHLLKQTGE